MGDYEKRAIDGLKKVEAAIVEEVNGKECLCFGWSLRITRTPTPPLLAIPTGTVTTSGTSVLPSAPDAV
jgi:hypothetical protein